MMNSTKQFTPQVLPYGLEAFDWRKPDPIVQEVWETKAQINKECDYSIDKLFELAKTTRLASATEK